MSQDTICRSGPHFQNTTFLTEVGRYFCRSRVTAVVPKGHSILNLQKTSSKNVDTAPEAKAAALPWYLWFQWYSFASGTSRCSMNEKPVLLRHGFLFSTIPFTMEYNKSLAFFYLKISLLLLSSPRASCLSPQCALILLLSQGLDLPLLLLCISSERTSG